MILFASSTTPVAIDDRPSSAYRYPFAAAVADPLRYRPNRALQRQRSEYFLRQTSGYLYAGGPVCDAALWPSLNRDFGSADHADLYRRPAILVRYCFLAWVQRAHSAGWIWALPAFNPLN